MGGIAVPRCCARTIAATSVLIGTPKKSNNEARPRSENCVRARERSWPSRPQADVLRKDRIGQCRVGLCRLRRRIEFPNEGGPADQPVFRIIDRAHARLSFRIAVGE